MAKVKPALTDELATVIGYLRGVADGRAAIQSKLIRECGRVYAAARKAASGPRVPPDGLIFDPQATGGDHEHHHEQPRD